MKFLISSIGLNPVASFLPENALNAAASPIQQRSNPMPKIRGIIAKEDEETGSRKGVIWSREAVQDLHKQIPGSLLVDVDGKATLYVTLEIDKDTRYPS